MFSNTVIPGAPRVMMIDASTDAGGWEAAYCERLHAVMGRRGIAMVSTAPVSISKPDELGRLVEGIDYNCICLFGPALPDVTPALVDYVDWLEMHVAGPKLLTACAWEATPAGATDQLLATRPTFAPIALMPDGPVSAREAGLGLMKFYVELALHAEQQTTGRMVWFSWRKAQEVLRRRGFAADWVLRT
jgi:hypothetical protein